MERTHKSKSSKTKMVYIVCLLLLLYLTTIWTVSIRIKVGAWSILLIIYCLEKIEKKYFISNHASDHNS
ncbi:hypothetical protein [Pullulanibacillus camelliae]|uniref:hypothetical protein n=1 Tax=Pullulanibacillus camelliae TaxID=1707096 RepID=UPI001663F8C4|nr:hypothetical protein [Pullulanibacillus camelliae]